VLGFYVRQDPRLGGARVREGVKVVAAGGVDEDRLGSRMRRLSIMQEMEITLWLLLSAIFVCSTRFDLEKDRT
jgi:hypothetical protein